MEWGIWAIIAVVLLILEMLTVDLTFLMLSGGAAAAALTSIATDNLVIQIVVAALVAVLLLVFVRPWARRHVNDSSKGNSNVDALQGKVGQSLTAIGPNGGRVKVQGEVWSARSYSPEIPADTVVIVQSVEGAHLVVVPAQ